MKKKVFNGKNDNSMSWAQVAAQGGTDLLGSVVNNLWYQSNLDKAFESNKQMAGYQHKLDRDMWIEQREYNSPAQQMARLKEAGINPHMAYAKGGMMNTTNTIPKYQGPRRQPGTMPTVGVPNVLQMYQNYQLNNAQVELVNEQRKTQEKMQEYYKAQADSKAFQYIKDREGWHGLDYWGKDAAGNMIFGATTQPGQKAPSAGREFYRAGLDPKQAGLEHQAQLWEKRVQELDKKNQLLQKQINWYVSQNIMKMVSTGAGVGLGVAGVGKFGRVAKGATPKMKSPSRKPGLSRDNSDIAPNLGFYQR